MARLGGAASAFLISRSSYAQSSPSAPKNLRIGSAGTRTLLTQSDFSYLGHYDIHYQWGNFSMNYCQGFTHRIVNGQLRFMTLCYPGYILIEFAPPSSYGSYVSTLITQWTDIWSGGAPTATNIHGLWWDEAGQRLWTTSAIDYPSNAQEAQENRDLYIRTLNSNGTISNPKGPFGAQGYGGRMYYGGVQAVPQWFQTQYGVDKYCIGWGGSASVMSQSQVSLGPVMIVIPDPAGYSNGSQLPAVGLIDCSSGSREDDWYAQGSPTSFDRGVRNTNYTNQCDSGYWLSNAPGGLGRWAWGDTNDNTGCWIDGTNKHGFITVPSFGTGNVFYWTSSLYCDSRNYEMQIFDPARLGEVKNGTRAVWNVKPASRWIVNLPGMPGTGGPFTLPGNLGHNVGGATYDSVNKRLYIYGVWMNPSGDSRIYIYDVNS